MFYIFLKHWLICSILILGRFHSATQFHWPLQMLHTFSEDGTFVQKNTSGINTFPLNQRRTRRHRTIFTEEQLQALEETFHHNQYPDVIAREQLAGRIQLREERVEVR